MKRLTRDPPPASAVYLHGNSGSRMDAHQAAIHLLQQDISVCAFDFSGSGLSEGSYVTLGQNEVGDVESVVSHLRDSGRADRIGLWGRSMGATTSLMFARKDPSLVGIVLDSPFSKLHSLLFEIAKHYKISIRKFFLRIAFWWLGKTLKRRAGVEIGKLDVSKSVASTFVPALFVHGGQDSFVDKVRRLPGSRDARCAPPVSTDSRAARSTIPRFSTSGTRATRTSSSSTVRGRALSPLPTASARRPPATLTPHHRPPGLQATTTLRGPTTCTTASPSSLRTSSSTTASRRRGGRATPTS